MVPQSIIHIPEICARLGVRHAVISPGSRSAPLTLAFARHQQIATTVVDDERTAGFVALGQAMDRQAPVVLICTSGSAGYNYAPAVAEAYFQQVPLVVLTADRPPEWIDQWDGQTIRQRNLYGDHIKASLAYPVETSHPDALWHADRLISEAVITATTGPMGPVQVNIPLREPFYPTADQPWQVQDTLKVVAAEAPQFGLDEVQWNALSQAFESHKKVLVVAGQSFWATDYRRALRTFGESLQVPVVADVISNAQGLPTSILHQDAWLPALAADEKEALRPDLLITFGKSVISKQLKLYLRKHRPAEHWHVQPHVGMAPDPFQSLTRIIPHDPASFFDALAKRGEARSSQYLGAWQSHDARAAGVNASYFPQAKFTEFEAIQRMLPKLPRLSDVHLANSMPVRYANFLGLGKANEEIRVFANRGTSGIDGCSSTARGSAMGGRFTFLFTGDVAFFYDRNAWWGVQPPANVRVVVLNNHGGGIFRMIPGPRQQPELEHFFETEQPLTAMAMAAEWGMTYHKVQTAEELEAVLPEFFNEASPTAQLLEIETDKALNTEVFDGYKQQIRASYGA